jgi:hypothetical protein
MGIDCGLVRAKMREPEISPPEYKTVGRGRILQKGYQDACQRGIYEALQRLQAICPLTVIRRKNASSHNPYLPRTILGGEDSKNVFHLCDPFLVKMVYQQISFRESGKKSKAFCLG